MTYLSVRNLLITIPLFASVIKASSQVVVCARVQPHKSESFHSRQACDCLRVVFVFLPGTAVLSGTISRRQRDGKFFASRLSWWWNTPFDSNVLFAIDWARGIGIRLSDTGIDAGDGRRRLLRIRTLRNANYNNSMVVNPSAAAASESIPSAPINARPCGRSPHQIRAAANWSASAARSL